MFEPEQHKIFMEMEEADFNASRELRDACISSIVCRITSDYFPLIKLAMLYEIIDCWVENGTWVDKMIAKTIDKISPPVVVGHDKPIED